MNFNENIPKPSWDCSKKFISMMNIHRQRFIQSRMKSVQPTKSDPEYLTLDNLSKMFHSTQKHDHSDATTDVSISTNTSAKQKLQRQLQSTAIRWWRPVHSPDKTNINCQQHLPYLMNVQSKRNDFPRHRIPHHSFDHHLYKNINFIQQI